MARPLSPEFTDRTLERMKKVFALRGGEALTFEDIGIRIGCSTATANNLYDRYTMAFGKDLGLGDTEWDIMQWRQKEYIRIWGIIQDRRRKVRDPRKPHQCYLCNGTGGIEEPALRRCILCDGTGMTLEQINEIAIEHCRRNLHREELRKVFEIRNLGFTFEEIGAVLCVGSDRARQRYHQHLRIHMHALLGKQATWADVDEWKDTEDVRIHALVVERKRRLRAAKLKESKL